ncbi:hypothetical protein G6514_001539 [Epicoccum nigrum]|nr:hypothetical protein G6514_001539 [Epicoccum nigrum]
MSSDSPPFELYCPPVDITSDSEGCDYFTAGMPHRRDAQKDLADPEYTLGTPIAELPGAEWQFGAPNAADRQMTHMEWLLDNTELPYGSFNEEYYAQADVDHPVDVPIQCPVPELLSPQVTSYKSSPTLPETPAATGNLLPGKHYFASDSSQNQGGNLFQCIIDAVAPDSTADVLTSSYEGSTLVQTLSGFDFDFDSSNQEFSWDTTQKTDVMSEEGWLEAPLALSQPGLHQVEYLLGDNFSPDTGSLDSSTTLGWEFEPEVPQSRAVLQRATTLPSRLPATKKLSMEELRARTGTWQLDDDQKWTACDPSIPSQEFDEAENSSQDHFLGSTSSEDQSPSALGYLHVFQSRKVPAREKRYYPVKCSHCERRYTGQFAKGNMRRHVIHKHGHGRGKLYRCRVCDKPYRRSDARGTHERLMHPRHQL